MKYSDEILVSKTHNGDTAYFFTINSRYSGYTYDKQLFHVLDNTRNAYASLTRAAFISFYENPEAPLVDNASAGGIIQSEDFIDAVTSDAGKIGIGVLALAALAAYLIFSNN